MERKSYIEMRNRRLVVLLAVFIFLFASLIIRIGYLQIVKADEYGKKAQSQWQREQTIYPNRGLILDRNGNVLAQSTMADSVLVRPKQISEYSKKNPEYPQELSKKLANILEMDYDTVYSKVTNTNQVEIWLKRKITKAQADAIKTQELAGVGFFQESKRIYPNGKLMAQVLGYTSSEGEGQLGIELRYNERLKGKEGLKVYSTDVYGNETPFSETMYTPAKDGDTITLTINNTIQAIVEKHAEAAQEKYQAKRVSAIAINPYTGEVLAIVNTPSFDLNNVPRGEGETDLLTELSKNTLVTDVNDPGSVFKTITLAAALESGVVNQNSTFVCGGQRKLKTGDTLYCDNHSNKHSPMTLTEALEKSCNTAFVDIALMLGEERFYQYIDAFGFGQKTGIECAGETAGILANREKLVLRDLASNGFGQGISVSSIQMIMAYSAAINGGTMVTPTLIKNIADVDGTMLEDFAVNEKGRVVSQSTSNQVKTMLKHVVDKGSGYRAKVSGYTVGGKTGTAQKYTEDFSAIKEGAYIASFIGFSSVEEPEILVLFSVDEPQGEITSGGAVAAPYVGDILKEVMEYYHGPLKGSNDGNITVPNVVGKTAEEAKKAIEALGLKMKVNGEGIVVEQMPQEGTKVKEETEIVLYLKKAEDIGPVEQVKVPNLTGKTIKECEKILKDLNLNFYSHGKGKAVWQNIKGGQEVDIRTEIRVEFEE